MSTNKKPALIYTPMLDTDVRPQDDFYGYVNNRWLKQHPIPADKSRWGTFDVLHDEAQKQLKHIFDGLENESGIKPGSVSQQIRDFYYTAMHADDFTQEHLTLIRTVIARLNDISDGDALSARMGELQAMGVEAPWNAWVDCDHGDSSKHILHLSQQGLTLPNRDYYLDTTAEMKKIRAAYQKHLEVVYEHFPSIAPSAQVFSKTILAFETALAKHSRTDAALRDVEANYHKVRFSHLEQAYSNINWRTYADTLTWQPSDQISVDQPEFLGYVDATIQSTPLDIWKMYLAWHFLARYYGRINETFAQLKFGFFGKVLGGAKELKPAWKRAADIIDDTLGQAAGQLYVARHFPESSKQQVLALVERLRAAYKLRIESLDWMTPASKAYACTKLANIKVLVGYPDKWRDFSGLTIGRDSLIANIVAAEQYNCAYYMQRLREPASRDEWFMEPQTVNAYHDPNRLVICFPAAILQPPFFDPEAPLAVNMGGIGAVIGHELTHGFDDQGCRFDAHGNVRMWQTKQDRQAFEKRARIIMDQADAYEVLPGLFMQGMLVIGESIADLGGIEIAYAALQASGPQPEVEGLSGPQQFFITCAIIERCLTRDEKKREYALSDPHPDSPFRVNYMLQHVDGFYEAFHITKDDALYRPQEKRARIW